MSRSFHRIYLSDRISSVAIELKKPIENYPIETLFFEEIEQFHALIQPSRKVEFLCVRELRNNLGLLSPIRYTKERKPFLDNQLKTFISISHSKNYCALGQSPNEVGVDIEEIHHRIERISSRFLNDVERTFIGDRTTEDLTKLWTMKEAMFKLNNRKGIQFKTELIIEARFGDCFSGKMLTENGWKQVKLECFQVGELVITACVYA